MIPKNPKGSNLPHLFHYQLAASESDNGLTYYFTTSNDITYKIAFTSDSEYLSDYPFSELVYSLSIAPITGEAGPKDPKIRHTVAYALNQAFTANPELVITYVCSTKDDQGRHRRILFGLWFREHGEGFKQLNHTDKDQIYSAAIYRKGHQHARLINQAFTAIYQDK